MLLNTGKREYRIVREVLTGETNDVYVCRHLGEPAAPYRTIWIVRNRRIAKELMGSLGGVCEECFMQNESAGFVFPYDGERPLDRFYAATVQNGGNAEARIWLEMVVRCMTSGIPSPVLNLMLRQNQVHIGADGAVWLGYFLDLSEYDAQAGEKENAALCAACIANLIGLDTAGMAREKRHMKKLIGKKLDRKKYKEFIQLYGDIRLMLKEDAAGNQKERLKTFVSKRRDFIYRLLSVFCIVLVCIVILMLAGHLLFGEFSLWKLFSGPLETIGTESLVR